MMKMESIDTRRTLLYTVCANAKGIICSITSLGTNDMALQSENSV